MFVAYFGNFVQNPENPVEDNQIIPAKLKPTKNDRICTLFLKRFGSASPLFREDWSGPTKIGDVEPPRSEARIVEPLGAFHIRKEKDKSRRAVLRIFFPDFKNENEMRRMFRNCFFYNFASRIPSGEMIISRFLNNTPIACLNAFLLIPKVERISCGELLS